MGHGVYVPSLHGPEWEILSATGLRPASRVDPKTGGRPSKAAARAGRSLGPGRAIPGIPDAWPRPLPGPAVCRRSPCRPGR